MYITFPVTELVIGFIDPPYEFNESDGNGSVVVGVVSGSLGTEVTVELWLTSGSALGRFTKHTQ